MPNKHVVNYCCINIKGGIRKNNQDNFFVQNRYRKSNEPDIDLIYSGEFCSSDNEIIAVYDGMGGEVCGEIASLIAASETIRYNNKNDSGEFLLRNLCNYLNFQVCGYAQKNNVSCMGTTAAIIKFENSQIFICNLGDSRIYRIRGNSIKLISKDHILEGFTMGKPPLTQFLGMPVNEAEIEPYVATGEYVPGDRYLLCSDGITDMLSDDDILKIVFYAEDVNSGAKELVSQALQNGGIDNITAILCEIKENSFFRNVAEKISSKLFVKSKARR